MIAYKILNMYEFLDKSEIYKACSVYKFCRIDNIKYNINLLCRTFKFYRIIEPTDS